MTVTDEARVIGTPMLRREDPALLTGEARYTNDLGIPGALHLAVLRSPYAHARLGGVDVSGALDQPGAGGHAHRSRPPGPVASPDALRVAGDGRHEEPAALPGRRVQGLLRG